MLTELINKITSYNKDADIDIVIKAYELAEIAHKGQKRKSGDDYIVHPISVAMILAELQLDIPTITASILHDVIEDTEYSFEDIKDQFSLEIADLVDGVTKISKLEFTSKEEQQAESLRKMIIAMAKDIRVILIKLADRLHNMRTLKSMPENKQKEKAQETLDIYAPIAHRLGISKIKWELEDISLRYLDPEGYYELVEKVASKRQEREEYIEKVIKELKERLDNSEIQADIHGRPKHFYSIYRKMVLQNKSFDQIFDLIAVRVIVNSIKDCYGVLGVAHTMWKPIPGRFKDYIAMPKPNMYQSLHTTVIGPKGDPFEIQIRTWEMHRTAEFGIAAHWKYKEGAEGDGFDDKLSWLSEILEWQRELQDANEFMETLKVDLFTDEVFVFTPKGDVYELPKGSCPLDFAYRIHSDVGNRCIGAKINGKIVPLNYTLQNGDIVEILTSSNSNGPSRDWLKIVKSSHARNKIRQYFKKEKKDENIQKGKELLEKEVRRQGLHNTTILKHQYLEYVAEHSNFNSIDDLYASIGFGGVKPNYVIQKIRMKYKNELNIENTDEMLELKENKNISSMKDYTNLDKAVKVSGFKDMAVRFSKCCNPVPGDNIVGYITRGRGVSVHRADCVNIRNTDDIGRLIDVEWVKYTNANFISEINIKAKDVKGLLTKITNTLSDQDISIVSLNVKTDHLGFAYFNLTIEVKTIKELNQLIKKLKKISEIISIYRI